MDKAVPWALLLNQLELHIIPRQAAVAASPCLCLPCCAAIACSNGSASPTARLEDALYEIESVRRFAGFVGVTDALPDETTILNFRHFLEDNGLTAVLLNTINAHLKAHGLLVSKGTMVDATIVHAPSSTKNQDKARDPDMHSTQKGNQWYFGMKIHIGADVNSGAVHSVTVTPANTADITELPKLLRGDDQAVFADAGYTSDEYKRGARHLGIRWCVNDKRKPNKNLSSKQKKRNRKQSSVLERGSNTFSASSNASSASVRPVTGAWRRTHRRSICCGLANLYLLRKPLMPA